MNQAERDKIRNRLSDDRQFNFKPKAFCGFIALNMTITRTNYYASLFHAFLLGFFINGVELIQQNILSDPNFYNYEAGQAIQLNSLITLEDLVIKILLTPLYGLYVDRVGRQRMVYIGYSLIVTSLMLFPVYHYGAFFNSVGWYFGIRIIYSNGSAILPILPLIADYVDNSTKGRAIGLNCLFMAIGTSLSTVVVVQLAAYNLFYTYVTFAGVIAIIGFSYACLLKSGNSYFKTPRASNEVETGQHLFGSHVDATVRNKRLDMVKKDCKAKPWIIASYIFAFINGTALATSSQILNLYVRSFPDDSKLGPTIVLRSNIASTVTSLLLGPSLDVVKPIFICLLTFAVSLFGYASIWAVKDPKDLLFTLIAVALGITFSCSQLMLKYLGFKNYRTSIRGLLFSIANILIMIGVIFIAVIGGNLFRYLDRNWPFYIGAGCTGVCLIVFLYVYFAAIRPQGKKKIHEINNLPLMKGSEIVMEEEDDFEAIEQEQDYTEEVARSSVAEKA